MVRVLICDDAVAFATLVRHWLSEDADIEVVGTAGSGAQARTAVARLRPDIILLDHLLYDVPRGSMQLVPQLRALHPELGVVLVSGMPVDDLGDVATRCGANAFVSKASKPGELCAAIRSAAAAPRTTSLLT